MRLFMSYHTPDYEAARRVVDALNAHKPGLDQRGGGAAGAHHARMPQPFINALAIQSSSGSAPLLGIRFELCLQRRELVVRRVARVRQLLHLRIGERRGIDFARRVLIDGLGHRDFHLDLVELRADPHALAGGRAAGRGLVKFSAGANAGATDGARRPGIPDVAGRDRR